MMLVCAIGLSRRAQFWRVIRQDALATWIDVMLGVFYVLSGFFLMPVHPRDEFGVVVMPFVILAGVLFYLLVRVSGSEQNPVTAGFYANLPRDRALTFRTHVVWLYGLAMALELVALAGIKLHLGTTKPGQLLIVPQYMPVLPFLVIAFALWCTYGNFKVLLIAPLIVTMTLFLGGFIALNAEQGTYATTPDRVLADWGNHVAIGLALLSVIMLWHADHRWARAQIGALR